MSDRTGTDVIRQNLRRLREDAGLRQDELAARARTAGLSGWTQATVASVETGRRQVSSGELLVLPSLLHVGVGELLRADDDEQIDLEGVTVKGADLARWAKGLVVTLEGPEDSTASRIEVTASEARSLGSVARRYKLRDDADTLASLKADSLGVTAEKAARSLGVWSPTRRAFEIAAAGRSLWGRPLADERDARWHQRMTEGDPQRGRGHVTRLLLKELEEHIRQHGGRRRTR